MREPHAAPLYADDVTKAADQTPAALDSKLLLY